MDDPDQHVVLRVKAVPGASRDVIAGMLGDRVKIRIMAAPEGGRANKAIIALLAKSIALSASRFGLVSGQRSAEKALSIRGATTREISAALGFDVSQAVERGAR